MKIIDGVAVWSDPLDDGADRTMSRTKAAGKKHGGKRTGGDVSREMMENWVRKKKVVLLGAGTDESPRCYKRLPDVLEQHAGNIRILQTLTPYRRSHGRRG